MLRVRFVQAHAPACRPGVARCLPTARMLCGRTLYCASGRQIFVGGGAGDGSHGTIG